MDFVVLWGVVRILRVEMIVLMRLLLMAMSMLMHPLFPELVYDLCAQGNQHDPDGKLEQ